MRQTEVSSESHLLKVHPIDIVTVSAHFADITIVAQIDPDDASDTGLADSAVLGADGLQLA